MGGTLLLYFRFISDINYPAASKIPKPSCKNGDKKSNHSVGTNPKSNIKTTEKDQIDTSNTQIHDRSLFWLSTCTSITSGRIKLVLWSQTSPLSEMMLSCKLSAFLL